VNPVIKEFGGVVPRAVTGLRTTDWSPASPTGARQLVEVVLDQLVLTGMSLMAGQAPAFLAPNAYAAAAQELSALGLVGAHADPQPLRVRGVRRRRIGRLAYEKVTFDHDPLLPRSLEAEQLGGPATAGMYLCRHTGAYRPWVVWVHGAGQGQPLDLLMSRARRLHHQLGFNIALPIQPGHGFRRNAWPVYPDREPLANIAGMMRAVSEVRAVVRWLQPVSNGLAVSGVSMGSPVAALVSQLENVDAVAVYTPILGLNAMIAHHLARGGPSSERFRPMLESEDVSAMTSVIDPLVLDPSPPPHRRLVVGATNDQMALREPALALHNRWGGQLYWYDGSHVGHIFSRRIQAVTEKFLEDALTA
jgi:hypothetical protein